MWGMNESKVNRIQKMAKISPFQQVHERLGATFDQYDGWQLPRDFGNPLSEQTAIENHCAAVDLSSFGRICLKGPDGLELLEKAGIRAEQPLTDGSWRWARQNGQTLRIGKIPGEVVILTLPGQDQALLETFERIGRLQTPDTDVINLSNSTAMLGLYGPSSVQSVAPVLPFDLKPLGPGGVLKISFFMMNLILFRGSWLDNEGLELLCPAAAGPMAAGSITKARQKHNIIPAGMIALRESLKNKELL
jgi:glycine cleavage system aminomethyltransferase T